MLTEVVCVSCVSCLSCVSVIFFNFSFLFLPFLKAKENKGIQKMAVCVSCVSCLSCVCFEKIFIFHYAHDKEKFEIVTDLISNLQNSCAFIQICPLINM